MTSQSAVWDRFIHATITFSFPETKSEAAASTATAATTTPADAVNDFPGPPVWSTHQHHVLALRNIAEPASVRIVDPNLGEHSEYGDRPLAEQLQPPDDGCSDVGLRSHSPVQFRLRSTLWVRSTPTAKRTTVDWIRDFI